MAKQNPRIKDLATWCTRPARDPGAPADQCNSVFIRGFCFAIRGPLFFFVNLIYDSCYVLDVGKSHSRRL
jgi:hypothetical protein